MRCSIHATVVRGVFGALLGAVTPQHVLGRNGGCTTVAAAAVIVAAAAAPLGLSLRLLLPAAPQQQAVQQVA